MADVEDEAYVYIASNINTDEFYVGSTNNFRGRSQKHLNYLSKNRHCNSRFQESYSKNPEFVFIGIPVPNRDMAFDIEEMIIKRNKDNPQLLNIAKESSRSTKGCKHREESRTFISQASSERMKDPERIELSRQAALKQWKDSNFRSNNCRSIIIDNTEYESAAVASRELGVEYCTIRKRANSSTFSNYYFKDEVGK